MSTQVSVSGFIHAKVNMLTGAKDSTVKMKSPLPKKSNISFTQPGENCTFSTCLILFSFFLVLRHCSWNLYIMSHHLREPERESEHQEVCAFTHASVKHCKTAPVFRCTQAGGLIFINFLLLTNPPNYRHGHGQQAKGWKLRNQSRVLHRLKGFLPGKGASSLARAAADNSQQ